MDGGVLRILNVDLSDNGLYTCVARTSLDEENATALLTVLGETGLHVIRNPASGNATEVGSKLSAAMFHLCWVADVPDAPLKLEISEIRSPRNISLSWVPGSDHNSSVTGNLEVLGFAINAAVCSLCCFKSSTDSSE